MTTLGLYIKPANTQVTMRIQPADDIVTYVVFVQKWTDAGKEAAATWHPDELESAAGASIMLVAARGYDLVLKAQVASETTLQAVLEFDGATAFDKTVALPQIEGPVVVREWSIIIR